MIALIILLVLMWVCLTSGSESLIFLGMVILVGMILIVASVVSSAGENTPPPPSKKRDQTEDEFNEMATTNLYVNYYLGQDANKAKEAKLAAKQTKIVENTPPKDRHRH